MLAVEEENIKTKQKESNVGQKVQRETLKRKIHANVIKVRNAKREEISGKNKGHRSARVLGLQSLGVSRLLTETRFRHKIAFYERQLRNERGMTARAESAIDKL